MSIKLYHLPDDPDTLLQKLNAKAAPPAKIQAAADLLNETLTENEIKLLINLLKKG